MENDGNQRVVLQNEEALEAEEKWADDEDYQQPLDAIESANSGPSTVISFPDFRFAEEESDVDTVILGRANRNKSRPI